MKKFSSPSPNVTPRDQTSMKTSTTMRRLEARLLQEGRSWTKRVGLALASGAAVLSLAVAAHAEEPVSGLQGSEEAAAMSPELSRALRPLSWRRSPGQGVSFGLEEGLWGNSWGQGLRATIPFTRYLGVTLRGLYLIEMGAESFTANAGGRLDFVGRSDVFLNVVRLYGGGGVQVLAPTSNTAGREQRVGVGGHFGFEFFHSPFFSYFLEVGGQGGEPLPGATVMAGLNVYPWTR